MTTPPSPSQLRPWRGSPIVAAVVLSSVLIAAIWLATWQRHRTETEQAMAAAIQSNSNLAIAYELSTEHLLNDIDQTLRLIESEYPEDGLGVARMIREVWPIDHELMSGHLLMDQGGVVRMSVGEALPEEALAHEFDFHQRVVSQELHIGDPVQIAPGAWRVVMSRRRPSPASTFGGIVATSVDARSFAKFYEKTELGELAAAAVVRADGMGLVRKNGHVTAFGSDRRTSTLFAEQSIRPSGSFLSAGRSEGVRRLTSYRTMSKYPLVVLIATAQDDVLGHVREREQVYYAACALATVLILLVTFAALRAIARHERHVATLASAKAALRRSEAQARAITEGMAAGIVATDEQFRIVSVNPAFTQCFGWSLEEVRGRTVECLAAPIEHARLVAMTQELHHRTQDFRESGQEFLAQRKNGEHFEVEVMMSRFDVEGERTYLGIVYDISERKQMERLMRANEEHFRATFDQALIGIVHASLAGRFVRVNQHMCDMLGYSELELLQRTSADVTHPDDRAASDGRFEALRADHRMHFESQVTKRFVRKDGTTLWALVAVNLIRAADGTPQYFLGMVQDITEIKRVDQMKSEFISTVSHELRTPLTSIRGSLGLLTGGMAGALPAAAKELVGIAENNCERLIRLVSDILDTERLEAGKMRFEPREMDVRPLVERAVESNDGFARMHGVRLRAVIPAAGVYGLVDPDCFAQVMTNLISNAVKFSPPDGEVTVALSRPSGETMRVEVIDQGPGIPIEFQPRIFRRFSQADSSATRDKGGTGLGLSIAKGIVEKHQGHIGFETAAGRGTTFHFEIPALAPAAVVLAD